jgi:hypothetical protein
VFFAAIDGVSQEVLEPTAGRAFQKDTCQVRSCARVCGMAVPRTREKACILARSLVDIFGAFRRFDDHNAQAAFRGAAHERFHALEGERSCIHDIVTIADNSVMNLILIILIVLLLFGGGGGYYYGGPVVGGGVGGLLLIVLVVYLLIGRRRV